MSSLKFIVLSLLALSCFADDRVKIDTYTESMCPDCIQFLTTSAKTAINTKDIELIADINLYPYGNAQEQQSGSQWVFTCQHGDNECLGNLLEVCTLNLTSKAVALPFIVCIEENLENYSEDFNQVASYCAGSYQVNLDQINNCMNSDLGNKIQHDVAVRTEKLQPSHQYVPWVVVNDQHDSDVENQIINDMLGYICQAYKGTVKIAACSSESFLA